MGKKQSAVRIESLFRKFHALSKYKKYLSARKIQSLIRKVLESSKYKKYVSARKIQSLARMKLVKKNIPTKEDRYNNIYENSVRHFTDAQELQRENRILVYNIQGMHKDLICPITLQRFVDPVVACDGNVYERNAIQQWLGLGLDDNNHRVSRLVS